MDPLTLNNVSAILITKEKEYPHEVLKNIQSVGFGEVIIIRECIGISPRYEIVPQFPDIYVQDDDCIPDIAKIFSEYDGHTIVCGMTDHHINTYNKSRICLIGHGAFFPQELIKSLEVYRNKFGRDSDYIIEADRIFTFLNFPQRRVETLVVEMPSSFASDRLSMRKEHYKNLSLLENKLTKFYYFSICNENLVVSSFRYGWFLLRRFIKKLNSFIRSLHLSP
jgi:hypothetical protein